MMQVQEIGEFELIRRIAKGLAYGPGVIEGIGDDACVLDVGGELCLLVTIDLLVEGSHFLRDKITPYQLGWKALAVNLSDIAAMGGIPRFFLVSLGIPASLSIEFVDEAYRGMKELASRFGVSLVGGDTVRSQVILVDVAALGQASKGGLLLRSGARPGDILLVTGHLGASAAGLKVLSDPALELPAALRKAVIRAHLEPLPRVAESCAIVKTGGATAMIDISDGLASEVRHICERSSVGARLLARSIPVDEATRAVARASGVDPLEWALAGGEDYELLFTARQDRVEAIRDAVKEATGTDVTPIGEILPPEDGVSLLCPDRTKKELLILGFNHFG